MARKAVADSMVQGKPAAKRGPASLEPAPIRPEPSELSSRRGPRFEQFSVQGPTKLDLLFVVDDSATMGGKQGLLAKGVPRMVSALQGPQIDADVRVAVTTTNMGGAPTVQGCGSSDGGTLFYRSCLDRPQAFTVPSRIMSRFNTACRSSCRLDSAALRTTNQGQPWLAFGRGRSNLADQELSVASALACLLPQGVGGCGYESQLDAMRAALQNASGPGGFLRDDANLAVIHVTDELDCSHNTEHPEYDGVYFETVFGPYAHDFWVPGQRKPASSSCFMAGTRCEPGPDGRYRSCEPQNWDLDRKALSKDRLAESVLRPVGIYQTQLEEIRRKKQESNPFASVFVGLVGGVDPETREIHYRDGSTQGQGAQARLPYFGIGDGCNAIAEFLDEQDPVNGQTRKGGTSETFALPPIRIRALIEAVNEPGLSPFSSICSQDWGPQLAQMAREATKGAGRTCAPGWVADLEPNSPTLVPDCELFSVDASGTGQRMAECAKDAQGYLREASTNRFIPPSGEDVCYLALTDRGDWPTIDPYDDMSMRCLWSSNVEFRVVQRTGTPPGNTRGFRARCRMWDRG